MIDIKFIRENKKEIEKGIKAKGFNADINLLLELDEKNSVLKKQIEEVNAERKKIAKEKNIEKGKEIKIKLAKLEGEEKILSEQIDSIAKKLPNIPLQEVPVGKDETENIVLREVGDKPKFDFPVKDYLELGEKLGWIDTERAGKVVGSRFGYLLRDAVNLEFALVRFALDILQKEGFIPIIPPVFLKPDAMRGMGYLDYNEDEIYHFEKDNLYLIGTSEQAIGAMHSNEIFTEKELPLRYAGFSSCFRREAGL